MWHSENILPGPVLVAGGAGYIGSHTCKLLARAGREPVVLDNLSTGHRWAAKFGPFYKDVNMAWMWARIKARTTRLGTFEGGFQKFADLFAEKLRGMGVDIRLGTQVKFIKQNQARALSIDAGGLVESNRAVVREGLSSEVEACIAGVVARAGFSATGGRGSILTIPVTFVHEK